MDEGIEFANVSPTSSNELYQFRSRLQTREWTVCKGKGDVCDSRCVHNLVESCFHGQGLPVAQNHEFWEQKGNLGREKTDRVRRLYGACF